MGDAAAAFVFMKNRKKAVRAKHGVQCPVCKTLRPKAHASILLPQQRCRVDRYVDPRPELTDEQWDEVSK